MKKVKFFTVLMLFFSVLAYGHRTGKHHAGGPAKHCPDLGIESPRPSHLKTVTEASDPLIQNFSWDKVNYIEKGVRSVPPEKKDSLFKETAQITGFSFSGEGSKYGICIQHSKHNEWPKRSNERINYQLLIPVNGKIYSRSVHPPPQGWDCALNYRGQYSGHILQHLLWSIGGWARVCNHGERNTRDANRPLDGWYPRPGEIMGFYVSSFGLKEKSEVVWVRVPDYNKVKSGGKIVSRYSEVASTEPTSEPASPAPPSTTATTLAPTPAATAAQPAATDCKTLRIQIPELQRRLDEQMKAYRGRRQKKWLGLKRNSCKNVQLCETLANAIHLAANNPSMASRLDHYKKQFGKNCKDFERCRAIAGEIERIRKDLDGSVRAYNKNCRG